MATDVERLIQSLFISTKKHENALNKARDNKIASLSSLEDRIKKFNATLKSVKDKV